VRVRQRGVRGLELGGADRRLQTRQAAMEAKQWVCGWVALGKLIR
jgi:hypothetical protein